MPAFFCMQHLGKDRFVMKRMTAFGLSAIFLFLTLCSCSSSDWISIDVLDIGKADCILIETGTKTVMIDTGEEEDISDIIDYLKAKGVETIDLLILTHFDKDHIGGAAELISSYGITTVLETGFSSNRKEYEAYHKVLTEQGLSATVLTEDYRFTLDSCSFTVYVPKESSYDTKEDNNASLIVAMEYGERRFLFCGDAMELRLAEFLSDSPGEFDYVKLPYHGNYLENYADFLDTVSPEYGVITCSNKNPSDDEALRLLSEYGVKVYETKNGSVFLKTDGKTIRIRQ